MNNKDTMVTFSEAMNLQASVRKTTNIEVYKPFSSYFPSTVVLKTLLYFVAFKTASSIPLGLIDIFKAELTSVWHLVPVERNATVHERLFSG